MIQLVAPRFLIIFTLLVGMMNLVTPFSTKEDSRIRNFLMLATSVLFLGNIVLLDCLFLNGIEASFTLIDMGKYSVVLHTEPLGMIFLSLLATLWVCALFYTIKFLEINKMQNSNRFLFFMNCCIMIGSIIALAANLFTMFVGYEILTLSTIPLIAHQDGKKVANGLFKYLKMLMLSGLALFLPAIIIIYTSIGHGNFALGGFIIGHFSNTNAIILLLMLIFGVTKAAIYPLHSWLPDAMVASYPVSALLHAVVVVKTGLLCIYKMLIYVFGLTYLQTLFATYNWLVMLPIITILYSAIQAIRYTQVKMVLAYSTINQLSIALMSAFMLSQKGIAAAIMHMVSHSFTKICIFYAAGNMYSVKNSYHIGELIGIRNTMPKTSFVMLIAGLSLMGIPPFAGFISKFCIMLAAAEQENLLVMITLGISTLFSALYVMKMLIFIYRPTSDSFILHLKLKPYFDETPSNKNSKRIISAKHKAEKRLPIFMILSIVLCISGVIGFFLIQQGINKFLMFI